MSEVGRLNSVISCNIYGGKVVLAKWNVVRDEPAKFSDCFVLGPEVVTAPLTDTVCLIKGNIEKTRCGFGTSIQGTEERS